MPDTVQVVLEFPKGVRMIYDATLANSFDGEYEMLYGSDAAMMMRESKAWMFKEVDSPLLGWEVYAAKVAVLQGDGHRAGGRREQAETGRRPSRSRASQTRSRTRRSSFALKNFLANAVELEGHGGGLQGQLRRGRRGRPDGTGLAKAAVRRPAAGYLEGFQSVVTAVKANEAIAHRQTN